MENCNEGVFFGLMDGSGLIIPINLVLVLIFFVLMIKAADGWGRLSWGLIWAGGILNLWDRFSFGCVRDYWQPLSFWPMFNLADSMIVVGIFIFALNYWKKNRG